MEKCFDIAVIGGGASGLCAAVSACNYFEKNKNRKAKIAIFDSLSRLGQKILVTGNGRCNISNAEIRPEDYYGNRDFAADVLSRLSSERFENFFSSLGLYLQNDGSGRLYPASFQASSVLDTLRFAIEENPMISIFTDTKICSIKKQKNIFILNDNVVTRKVIISTGGKSARKLGCDGSGYELLNSLGIKINPVFPCLTSLILNDYPKLLKGTRAVCGVSLCEGNNAIANETGEVQFNENGVSGIPVLQISRFASKCIYSGKNTLLKLHLDCLPGTGEGELIEILSYHAKAYPSRLLGSFLIGHLPKNLGFAILKSSQLSQNSTFSSLKPQDIERIVKIIKKFSFTLSGVGSFDNSQVTGGGADCSQFSGETLEAKSLPGLYCCGEVLDIDGRCGGYNLHWAFSSSMLAGENAANAI